jgi:Pyruvate/2-oxoacid:ferredoxin oxidoreductase delta subunit
MQNGDIGMKPFIDKNRCSAAPAACQATPACPDQAIHYVVDATLPLGGRMEVDESVCTGCGLCAQACCGDAIEMI